MTNSEISLVGASSMASTLPAIPGAFVSQIEVPIVPQVTDGSHYVTIPANAEGVFEWPYYDKPLVIIVNQCTAPITVRLGLDEGACIAAVFRGDSSNYLFLDAGPGNYPGGGSGKHVLTLCDALFKKHFPEDFTP